MIVADRELVETGSDEILENAKDVDVAFLVVGDPFGYAGWSFNKVVTVGEMTCIANFFQSNDAYRPRSASS